MKHLTLLTVAAALSAAAFAQQAPPTQVVVTAMADHGGAAPNIAQTQVQVKEGGDPLTVTGWEAATGRNAVMQLAIVIDDDTHGLNAGIDDLKDYVRALPPTTHVIIAYMHSSTVEMAQLSTTDHVLAASKLREPGAGSSPSPYGSLEQMLHSWRRFPNVRREIILISDGQEHAGGNNSNNNTIKQAVADAVANGVVVYAIAASDAVTNVVDSINDPSPSGAGRQTGGSPFGNANSMDSGALGAGFGSHSVINSTQMQTNNGMQSLAELVKATGGELFAGNNGHTPSNLKPFLTEINECLQSQYLLDFAPTPTSHGGMTALKVEISGTDVKVTAPEQVIAPKKN